MLLSSFFIPSNMPEIYTSMQPIIIRSFKLGEDILMYLKEKINQKLKLRDKLSHIRLYFFVQRYVYFRMLLGILLMPKPLNLPTTIILEANTNSVAFL